MNRRHLVPLALLALASCAAMDRMQAPVPERAVAVLRPTEGSSAHGVVVFTSVSGGVRVVADVQGLAPGAHGFHVHEFGDVTAADGTSAGGHFNPHGVAHALPDDKRHVGDLGNLVADDGGIAHYDRVDPNLAFAGGNSILGRGLVVHAKTDDGGQPTGNAGARVAVGVIGVGKAE